MKKIFFALTVLLIIFLGVFGIYKLQKVKDKSKNVQVGEQQLLAEKPQENPIKTFKQFTLTEIGKSGAVGHGTIVMNKDGATSVTVYLTKGPTLKTGEEYAVFVQESTESKLDLIGAMINTGKNGKIGTYVTGNIGPFKWYDAQNILVYVRSVSGQTPNQLIASASLAK